jgi:hypothetical protein
MFGGGGSRGKKSDLDQRLDLVEGGGDALVHTPSVAADLAGGMAERDAAKAALARATCIDLADTPEVRHVRGRHVRPVLAVVARDVYEPIIGARPDDISIELARSDREDRRVDLGPSE